MQIRVFMLPLAFQSQNLNEVHTIFRLNMNIFNI